MSEINDRAATGRQWGRPHRPLVCWACEELLALRTLTGQQLIEADATLVETGGRPAIACRCGAVTRVAPRDD